MLYYEVETASLNTLKNYYLTADIFDQSHYICICMCVCVCVYEGERERNHAYVS
jgi:hypothetical protein